MNDSTRVMLAKQRDYEQAQSDRLVERMEELGKEREQLLTKVEAHRAQAADLTAILEADDREEPVSATMTINLDAADSVLVGKEVRLALRQYEHLTVRRV